MVALIVFSIEEVIIQFQERWVWLLVIDDEKKGITVDGEPLSVLHCDGFLKFEVDLTEHKMLKPKNDHTPLLR